MATLTGMDFDSKYDRADTTALTIDDDGIAALAAAISSAPLVSTTPLGGGYSNHNLLIGFGDGERCVLRLSSDIDRLELEADIHALLAARVPDLPVPAILGNVVSSDGTLGALALAYVEGEPLHRVEDSFSAAEQDDICAQLGQAAAAIHRVRFERSGELGPGPTVLRPFESYAAGMTGFFESALSNSRLQERIGFARRRRLEHCLLLPDVILGPSVTGQLTHGDFNQKNILIDPDAQGRPIIAAILDWEFALSASGIMDLGNLLRFEAESPSADAVALADAYREAGGILDDNWRAQSLFADLQAQLAFLIRDEDLPRTFATAIDVIDRTLDALGIARG